MTEIRVPFFRPDIRQAEIDEVVSALKSGWLTQGPRIQEFEARVAGKPSKSTRAG